MSRKKINFEKKTKLSSLNETPDKEGEGIKILTKKTEGKSVSFRLRQIDIERITNLLSDVNKRSTSQYFSRSQLLRGLIMLGNSTDSTKILEKIRESL